jgi:carbon starvation protein
MNGIALMLIAIVILGGAYLFYGRFLAKKWGIDSKKQTPAFEFEDGVDYVPADRGVVFGHQFASIAGAGPINGPIQAAIFGWIPVFLWVIIGGVFFGAVQDFAAMYASVRNKGKTIGFIIEEYIGKVGMKLFLIFSWLFCILVVAAFGDVVAGTFNGFSVAENGAVSTIQANGAVAMTSMIFIIEAVILGLILQKGRFNTWINTAIAIAMLIIAIVIGLNAPIFVAQSSWHIIVFLYVLVACIVPVWALLQPRDYLNSYLLVVMLSAAVVGVFVANPTINLPAFTSFNVGGQPMFPILFVTVACGAVSGFHSLVSSGTSSKQIRNERDMLPISFGSMLLESLLAVISIIAVASFATAGANSAAELGLTTPPQIFAGGIAGFLETLHLPSTVTFTLINLAISAFALTSLDSVARIGRLSFQEFFQDNSGKPLSKAKQFLTNKYVATILTLFFAYLLAKAGYAAIWPLFGSANQLLSALALIACAVFFKKTKRLYSIMVAPIFIMMAVTFSALVFKIYTLGTALSAGTSAIPFNDGLQLVFAVLVFGLGVSIAVQGLKALLASKKAVEEEKQDA